jgi:gas vesicle protein
MEKTASNYNGLLLGFFAGGAVGILTGLMFATKSGKELRSDIKDTGSRIYEDAQQMMSEIEMKTKSVVGEARQKADELRKEADLCLSGVRSRACRALSCEQTGAEA